MAASSQPPNVQKWDRYPQDLPRTYKSRRALRVYHDRLAREDIFVSEGKPRLVDIWERRENENAFRPEARLESQEELSRLIGDGSTDSSCRFIFLYTESSRGKLCCTRRQLNQVLARHEVMPAFLDFVFEFKNKENPTTSTMFRFEDHITSHQQSGPDNPRMQHAFNIIAPEQDPRRDPNTWLIRHTAVYHSFDLAQAKSAWITVKADSTIRERITSTGDFLNLGGTDTEEQKAIAQFSFALSTHVQILEWCTEGWAGYIESLEERVRKHVTAIKLAPVEALARKPPRRSTRAGGPRAAATGFSEYSSHGPQPSGAGRRILSFSSRVVSGLSRHSRATTTTVTAGDFNPMHVLDHKTAGRDEDDEHLDQHFSFDDLQRIRQVTDDAEQARMIINENGRIIRAVQNRYQDLIRSWTIFSGSCKIDRSTFENLVLTFCEQLTVFLNDLESSEARVDLLLRSLERNEAMFQGILQYCNMRVGEHYARSAETSANTMEVWTERMHNIAAETEHETVSMHGITVLTLIFLPGTFVSTLFSSGIMDFNRPGSQNIGDWETRIPALKLFFAISIPLMVFSLTFWWITYRWAKGKHKIVPSQWIPDALRSEQPPALTHGAGI